LRPWNNLFGLPFQAGASRAAIMERFMARKAKKSVSKTKARKAKAAKRTAAKRAVPKRKVVPKRAKPASRRPAAAKKDVIGEGNYTASRNFRAKETAFVKRNKAKIRAMGKAAEDALEGPQGDALRAAEAEARGHARS
jgi:hypothetical protein